jgi:hypothetical protein
MVVRVQGAPLFIHWSCSCAIVTAEFDYIRKVISMNSFGGLSMPRERYALLTPHFVNFKNVDEGARALGLSPSDQIYQVEIKDATKQMTCYIIQKPLTNKHIFPLEMLQGLRLSDGSDCPGRVSKYEPG